MAKTNVLKLNAASCAEADYYYKYTTMTIYVNTDMNTANISVNGEMVYNTGNLASIADFLEEYTFEDAYYKGQPVTGAKMIVFINDLHLTHHILPEGHFNNTTKTLAVESVIAGTPVSVNTTFVTDRYEFRHFNIIANMTPEDCTELLFGVDRAAETDSTDMHKFLFFLADSHCLISQLKYSLAHITVKRFYKEIGKTLLADTKRNGRYFDDIGTFLDMWEGNTAGFLRRFEGADDAFYLQKLFADVVSYDLSSAYPGAFIRAKFPVGKVLQIYTYEDLQTVLQSDRFWAKVVVEISTEEITDRQHQIFRLFCKDWTRHGHNVVAFDKYDIEFAKYMGVNLIDEIRGFMDKKHHYRAYYAKQDYLHPLFIEHLLFMYNKKEGYKEEPNKKFLVKTQIDMLFGKSIQNRTFTAEDMDGIKLQISRYLCKGEHYLQPHMGMIAISFTRLELIKTMKECNGHVIAYDTDGIKFVDCEEVRQGIARRNQEIRKELEARDIHSTIGQWKFEYKADRFIQFAPKVYAYIVNVETDKIICKFAGCETKNLSYYMEQLEGQMNKDSIFRDWKRFGIHVPRGVSAVEFDKKFCKFRTKYFVYSIDYMKKNPVS